MDKNINIKNKIIDIAQRTPHTQASVAGTLYCLIGILPIDQALEELEDVVMFGYKPLYHRMGW